MFPQFDDVADPRRIPGILIPVVSILMKRIDYHDEIGIGRAKEIVASKSKSALHNGKGCWLFCGSKNTDGYGQIFVKPNSKLIQRGRQAQKAFLLHVLSYVASENHMSQSDHVSHRCHERSCFNPGHLVAESPCENNSRKGCPGTLKCPCCDHIVFTCPHSPSCL